MPASYGPGRYDPEYEEAGRGYPYGLVRWTSRRNLEHFLRLLGQQRLDLAPLVSAKLDVSGAAAAYARVKAGAPEDYGVLFDYGPPPQDQERPRARVLSTRAAPRVSPDGSGPVRLAPMRGGEHANTLHLPSPRTL